MGRPASTANRYRISGRRSAATTANEVIPAGTREPDDTIFKTNKVAEGSFKATTARSLQVWMPIPRDPSSGTCVRYYRGMRINLSDQSVDALAEIISGGSAGGQEPSIGLYRQGWRLEAWFKTFGVPFDIKSESRLPATKTAIHSAMFIDGHDGELLTRIITSAADPRDFINDPARHVAVVDYLNQHLFYDGLKLESGGRTMRLIQLVETAPVTSELSAMADGIDFDTVGRDLDRALRAATADPELAVTSACSVVESVCRSILVELKVEFPAKLDISTLYRAVRDPLGLDPMKEGLAPEIVNDVKAVLSGISTSVQGIGSLRTHVGGAHGKEKGFRRIDARIAKLAIHSASAIALFIIETWQLRHPGRTLPLSREPKEES